MSLMVLTGSANAPLAQSVGETLGVRLAACRLQRFPDGELHVELQESVRGRDVYLLQPTSPRLRCTCWSCSYWRTPAGGPGLPT